MPVSYTHLDVYKRQLVTYVLEHEDSEDTSIFCEQLYDLALLSHGSLSPERMSKFIARTNDVMLKLAE